MIFNSKKIVSVTLVSLTLTIAGSTLSAHPGHETTNDPVVVATPEPAAEAEAEKAFDWNPVMDAIIVVESKGDANAVSGIYCGAMQISPVCVEECNSILKARKSKKRYTLNDRFSVKKSKEMFRLIQSKYNPDNNVEKAIRSWSGGIHYKQRTTNRYYSKVMAAMGK